MSNEWYTPSRYVEAARAVMGGIDLDPASCELANKIIKAKEYYSEAQNGLLHAWRGRVWLNPPYGLIDTTPTACRYKSSGADTQKRSLQTMFVRKALSEYACGNVAQLIMLVTANTTVAWFQPLWNYPMCTPFPKIGFWVPGESEAMRQVFGNAVVYLGPHESTFVEVFSTFGRVVKAIDTPRPKPITLSLWESIE